MRPFPEPATSPTKTKVTLDILQPPAQDGLRPTKVMFTARPNRGEGVSLAEAAFGRLSRGVIMRMNDDRLRDVTHLISLSAAPTRVFVIFRVLHSLVEAALGPNVFADPTGHHAEKVVPPRGFAVRAETTFVITRVN